VQHIQLLNDEFLFNPFIMPVLFLCGRVASFTNAPKYILAHLLMAQIQLHQGNYLNAQQSLEVGLSYNFEVRDHPLFHLVTFQKIA
jgi:hypothetical protein